MPIYLIRHGESQGNIQRLYQGRLDLPLTARGEEQAATLGRWLARMEIRCDAVYASPLQRAQRTAQIAGGLAGLPTVQTEPLIQEYFVGELEGLSVDEIEQRWPGFNDRPLESRGDFAEFGGESYDEMQQRLGRFIERIHAQYRPEQSVLAVGHGGSFFQLLKLWCGYPAPRHFFARLGNCTCFKLQLLDMPGQHLAQLLWMTPVELMEMHLALPPQGSLAHDLKE